VASFFLDTVYGTSGSGHSALGTLCERLGTQLLPLFIIISMMIYQYSSLILDTKVRNIFANETDALF